MVLGISTKICLEI